MLSNAVSGNTEEAAKSTGRNPVTPQFFYGQAISEENVIETPRSLPRRKAVAPCPAVKPNTPGVAMLVPALKPPPARRGRVAAAPGRSRGTGSGSPAPPPAAAAHAGRSSPRRP